jgi:hypothetical protein
MICKVISVYRKEQAKKKLHSNTGIKGLTQLPECWSKTAKKTIEAFKEGRLEELVGGCEHAHHHTH